MLTESQALGPALRLLRTRHRLRQYQVAEKAGLTKAMLSSYEVAGVKPSLHSLNAILTALESDLSEFQLAIDVITGRADLREFMRETQPESPQPASAGDPMVEILVPRLAGILPVL